MLHHTEILGVKNIGTSFIFKYRHILIGTCLFHNGIFPSAGMGTGSLICISSHQIITQQTSSGIRYAHCSMNKGLYFQLIRNMCTDLADFLQRQFSGCNDSLCTQPVPEKKCLIIRIVCLCADMTFDFRTDFPGIGENSRICNDQCIRLQFLQLVQIFSDSFQILIMGKYIYCHIYFYSMSMGKLYSFRHIIVGKILCFRPESKCLSSYIYRICSKYYSYF